MAPDPASPGAGVFLDTGYLVALEDADNHAAARKHREGLRQMPVLTSTSYVLDEAVTLEWASDEECLREAMGPVSGLPYGDSSSPRGGETSDSWDS